MCYTFKAALKFNAASYNGLSNDLDTAIIGIILLQQAQYLSR